MLIDGQAAIFKAIEDMRQEMKDVGVQRNEITHINMAVGKLEDKDEDKEERLGKIEGLCIKNHALPDRRTEKPFGRRIVEGVIMAVVISISLTLCGILGFTMFVNTQAFYDFHHTQVSKTVGK
jgi:hypothetical protein